MTTVTESFPLSLVVAVGVVALCVLLIKWAATFDTKKALAHRELLRAATPPHDQSRAGDFDEWGRTW